MRDLLRRRRTPAPGARPGPATGPAADAVTARSRRRFARRQWARRWLAWRPLLVLALVVALVGVGTWLVLFSSVLAVQRVEVTGQRVLSADQVRAAAAVPDGDPLARVSLESVRARVEALAVVGSAEVTREWPDTVRITVTERVAVAVVEIGGRWRAMDADGVVFREFRVPPPGLPRVQTTAGTGAEALSEAAEVASALPDDLAGRVDHLTVETVDLIELVLADGRTVLWGSAEESALKAEVLVRLLQQPARHYDVSVPGNPTTSGAPAASG